ncbi:MAG TPA: ABC transporter ATP-binding protein [Chloroflexota bacterium]|nr:ABC transporter ATP-binding protein [Chloroflexota bacterium]
MDRPRQQQRNGVAPASAHGATAADPLATPDGARRDAQAPTAVVVDHVTKRYGGRPAVDALSFTVRPGEIFALLGPNGAGKTTTLEILEGYRAADAGSVAILGLDPRRDGRRLKPRVGVMLQQDGLQPGLTAREILRLYARFFADPQDPEALLERVGLRDAAHTRARRLSGGQKRRLALAVALIGKPALVVLDEPTTGMDPQARLATWEIVRGLRDAGTTVLLTTHFMDEAERLADRVAIIDHGRLVALDTPRALTQDTEAGLVRFVAEPGLDTGALGSLPGVRAARETQPGRYTLEGTDTPALIAELAAWLRDGQVTLSELRVGHQSLEETFLRLTGSERL